MYRIHITYTTTDNFLAFSLVFSSQLEKPELVKSDLYALIYDYQTIYPSVVVLASDISIAPQLVKFAVSKAKLSGKVAEYVDVLAIAGYGSKEYSVKVVFADGSSEDLAVGYFGEGEEAITFFNVGKEVKMFVITMEEPSNGGDLWSEIATLVVK